MSVDLWLIGPNEGSDWCFDKLEITGRKRDSYYWVKEMLKEDFITKKSIKKLDNFAENDQSGNTISFLNCVSQALNYKEKQMINTLNVYKHKNYTIQVSYIMDHNYENSNDLNYFATMVNTECMKIYGPAIYFKTENGLTVNLTINELLNNLLNYYHVTTFRYKNNVFEEICCKNMEYEIESLFKSYYKIKIGDWIILSEVEDNINNFKNSNNKLKDFTDLIFFKLKSYSGDIYDQTKDEITNIDDYRGLYMDIDKDYIMKEFF